MKVNQIFQSINGEICGCHQGSLCTFIRLAGCNLKCRACDTTYAQSPDSGIEMTIDEVAIDAAMFQNNNITITGGEPLLQIDEVIQVARKLMDNGFFVSIETNGTFEMSHHTLEDVSWVADWKGPSSGMRNKMDISNYFYLDNRDFIKFVIADMSDFVDAMRMIYGLRKAKGSDSSKLFPKFAFSPSFGEMDPVLLIEWMKQEPFLKNSGAIMSYQLHKILKLKEG